MRGLVAVAPPAPLAPFVGAGFLAPADVHVALAITRASGCVDPTVLVAAALAVRAPRLQHVCVDLRHVDRLVAEDPGDHGADDGPGTTVPWPALDGWLDALASSPAVAPAGSVGTATDAAARQTTAARPLVLDGHRLYLDRLWRDERTVATALHDRARTLVPGIDHDVLRTVLDRWFDGPAPDHQRIAAATAALRHLTVVAGGPGTGKTTTVARLLAVLDELAAQQGARAPTVALAAPTGKAANRLTESLREAAGALAAGPESAVLPRLLAAEASTVHRLLGWRPDARGRFRHGPGHPLPHDVVVVDETSMVSLPLIARLLEALRPSARLVLLGDPQQLASIEAGSVLGDVVGEPSRRRIGAPTAELLRTVVGAPHAADLTIGSGAPIDEVIVTLERVHRFDARSGIADVARAIQVGDADAAIERLRAGGDVTWLELGGDADERTLAPARDVILAAATGLVDDAEAGDGEAARSRLGAVRVLCAHRHGSTGVDGWNALVERWLTSARPASRIGGRSYPGRPVLVLANDRRAHLVNGDVGVEVAREDGTLAVALPTPDGSGTRLLAPSRVPRSETVHAMTVHKSQGSQFDTVVVVLPDERSPLLTRELLYTAITRGRRHAIVIGGAATLRAAIGRRAVRASGLGSALRADAARDGQPVDGA